ncbi:GNAT family N-acetyltransferase [Methylobacillus gramineus]|uniref:GNAT family N-acetyltransferase n=1 Tax=Methylobacillus gramineus TaxID=755169 RepID=UPI001CFFF93D|nr:GNAT family N-acetyltransferase [Methylobacillus gramineus]MCB5185833.1 GNAT family N-acetyltransferase [Methylobacillus gramineus]
MILVEMVFGSSLYQQSLALRQLVLRTPLGLVLNETDVIGEEEQWHWGFIQDDVLQACLVIKPQPHASAKLRQMAVSPALQDQGLGRQLLAQAIVLLRERGFTDMTLDARQTAVNFYRCLGFVEQGAYFPQLGIPHIVMTQRI